MAGHMGAGQLVPAVISTLSQAVHGAAAGVTDAQHPSHLVKALPCCIVTGAAQHLHLGVRLHVHNGGRAAGDAQADKRGLQIGVGEVICRNMAPHMMDWDQGQIQGHGRALGKVHSHQHRADETRRIGHSDGIQVAPGHPRLLQSLVGQTGHCLHMLAGGDLGYYAAVNGMHLDLRGHTVGQHRPPVFDNCSGGLVAGGFNG